MEPTIPLMLRRVKEQYPNLAAQHSKDDAGIFQPTSYGDLYREVQNLAAGLMSIGVGRGDHVGLISDNRKEWLVADLALQCIGAADVPRGCDSTAAEIQYILGFADCRTAFVENRAQLERVLDMRQSLSLLTSIIVLEKGFTAEEFEQKAPGMTLHTFEAISDSGTAMLARDPMAIEREIDAGTGDSLATIIFTSGTTGEPKGVMLSHRNFLHQVKGVPELIDIGPGDIWLCVLPVWHSFERIMQYVALGTASALAYSKPISKIMLQDFQAIRPTWLASVPRIWDALKAGIYRNVSNQSAVKRGIFAFFVAVASTHARLSYMMRGLLPRFKARSRVLEVLMAVLPYLLLAPLRALGNLLVFKAIHERLGGRFVAGISGGGALPEDVDSFFAAAGVLLLEGYGLTETAPVLGVRAQHHPVPGTVGPIFPGTEVKIVDDNGRALPPGTKGLVLGRGPQVMLGYYKRPEDTAKIISADGWLNTGDLGMLTLNNELKILGRAKDTIVLLGGENVEPLPIEQKLCESVFISQAMVLGQDQKYLAALILPNREALEQFASTESIPTTDYEALLEHPRVIELFNSEISERVNPKSGFKNFERIFRFRLVGDTFEIGRELSAKQEIKRHVLHDKYAKMIRELFV
ncbi:MAG TPA: AMP-binding protein [Spirochaetia bacterium]|nr:AMP-binding protein [Spirochaetia bacterium]